MYVREGGGLKFSPPSPPPIQISAHLKINLARAGSAPNSQLPSCGVDTEQHSSSPSHSTLAVLTAFRPSHPMPSETCALCHRVIVCGGIGPIENDGHIKHRHLACALLSTGVWLDTRNVDTSELSEEEKAQLASLLLEPSFEAAYSETLLARITPALVNLDSALSADHKCKKCRSSNASISILSSYPSLVAVVDVMSCAECSRKECNTHYHHHCINARDEPVFCAPVALCRSGSDFVLRPTRY